MTMHHATSVGRGITYTYKYFVVHPLSIKINTQVRQNSAHQQANGARKACTTLVPYLCKPRATIGVLWVLRSDSGTSFFYIAFIQDQIRQSREPILFLILGEFANKKHRNNRSTFSVSPFIEEKNVRFWLRVAMYFSWTESDRVFQQKTENRRRPFPFSAHNTTDGGNTQKSMPYRKKAWLIPKRHTLHQ